jgi:L-alanine-DL-glutamate epimerase-like enolase superfamily enzyme
MISFFLLFLNTDPAPLLLPPEAEMNDISASAPYYPRDIVDLEFKLNSDGTISVPDGPRLGVEVDEKAMDNYTIAREAVRL